MAHTLPQYLPC